MPIFCHHDDTFYSAGDKKFLLGDKPCQADCAVFGQLAEFYWHSFGNVSETTIKGTFLRHTRNNYKYLFLILLWCNIKNTEMDNGELYFLSKSRTFKYIASS